MYTLGSQLSVALAWPADPGAGKALHSAVVLAGTTVNTGDVLSLTSIVCDAVEVLPQLSVAFHLLVNV